jgi:hypothetical protein
VIYSLAFCTAGINKLIMILPSSFVVRSVGLHMHMPMFLSAVAKQAFGIGYLQGVLVLPTVPGEDCFRGCVLPAASTNTTLENLSPCLLNFSVPLLPGAVTVCGPFAVAPNDQETISMVSLCELSFACALMRPHNATARIIVAKEIFFMIKDTHSSQPVNGISTKQQKVSMKSSSGGIFQPIAASFKYQTYNFN